MEERRYALVCMANERGYLPTTMPLALERLVGNVTCLMVFDDVNGNGYTAQMRMIFQKVRELDVDYVFFLEEDFILTEDVPLDQLAELIEQSPYNLAQVALLRQPWYPNEVAAGGVIEAVEKDFAFKVRHLNGYPYIHHYYNWTGNPSLIPIKVFSYDWPLRPWSERRFGRWLVKSGWSFAYWGGDRAPRCEHVGVRVETSHGY